MLGTFALLGCYFGSCAAAAIRGVKLLLLATDVEDSAEIMLHGIKWIVIGVLLLAIFLICAKPS